MCSRMQSIIHRDSSCVLVLSLLCQFFQLEGTTDCVAWTEGT